MKVRTLYEVGHYAIKAGFILWLLETIVFQMAYGFHWDPINAAEVWLDRLAGVVIFSGFCCFYVVLSRAVDFYVRLGEGEDDNTEE